MTDVRVRQGGTVFALRAGVACVRGDRVLVICGDWFDFLYFPGGAVAVNEDAATCAAREFEEETGVKAGPLRLLATMENFFELKGERWHEVGFSFRMDAPPELPDSAFPQRDDERLTFDWVPVAEMEARRVMPPGLQEALLSAAAPVHHITQRQ